MDAVVSARNLATNAVASAKADSSGRYLVINLQPGNYELTASVSSFSPYTQQVVVEVGVVTTADIVLELAGQTQTVTVSGEASTVDTEQSTFARIFNSVALENLPINARQVVLFCSFDTWSGARRNVR